MTFAGFRATGQQVWGIQFHPEVWHSTEGPVLLKNFVMGICGCVGAWTPDNFVEATVAELQAKIGADDRVILGLSGGVDSTVAAELLNRAMVIACTASSWTTGCLGKTSLSKFSRTTTTWDSTFVACELGSVLRSACGRTDPRPSARPLAAYSSRCSTRRLTRWKVRGGWGKGPFIPMSSSQ